ncbi:MAG: helix-turn-helix transcriptional regulator [Bacteriovoracaceae bacterium]|nr:helix-turn-helix transcriptional regulator [Bacteriovoracaceae bacterium]
MIRFNKDYLDDFLGVVRKYMQMRGNLSQKDLAEITNSSVSTMSRFLNKKTHEIDEQVIARVVHKLGIPLHEMIDFVHEEDTGKFKMLVEFYKESEPADKPTGGQDELADAFGGGERGTAQKTTSATVSIGGKKRQIPFGSEGEKTSIKEKLDQLSPRQKAYLTDFLDLDVESRDLMVDIGNSLFRYFKQKGVEF